MCAENLGQLTKSWSRARKSCASASEQVAVVRNRPLSRASRSILSTSRSISPSGAAGRHRPRLGRTCFTLIVKRRQRLEPLPGPRANGAAVAGLARLEKTLRPVVVLLEVRSGREREGIGATRFHTNLLSRDRPESARVGQKEGSYLPNCVLRGGHGPFRGLEAPLALALRLRPRECPRQRMSGKRETLASATL